MNEQQIVETMTRLIGDRFYGSYDEVVTILDTYLAYGRITKETYGQLAELARMNYPEAQLVQEDAEGVGM